MEWRITLGVSGIPSYHREPLIGEPIVAARCLVGRDDGQPVCHVIDGVGCIREASCTAMVAPEWRVGMADDASRIRPTLLPRYLPASTLA